MSVEEIKKKIIGDAQKEAEIIKQRALEKADSIKKAGDEEFQRISSDFSKRIEDEKESVLTRKEIVARLDIRKVQLADKQQCLSRVFDEAVNFLSKMKKKEYLGFIESLLDKAVVSGHEKIMVGEKETNIDENFISQYNADKGSSIMILPEKGKTLGGFILVNETGDIETDCSIETLIKQSRDQLESEVVGRLFE